MDNDKKKTNMILKACNSHLVISTAVALLLGAINTCFAGTVHLWEKVEITLHAENYYDNPYTEVEVWVDLKGLGFEKRCYGFWDGGSTFRVRVMATSPGDWTWQSGSNPNDPGLVGSTGTFTATAWTQEELLSS